MWANSRCREGRHRMALRQSYPSHRGGDCVPPGRKHRNRRGCRRGVLVADHAPEVYSVALGNGDGRTAEGQGRFHHLENAHRIGDLRHREQSRKCGIRLIHAHFAARRRR